MGEIAVFLGKIGVFLCFISSIVILRAFLQPIKISFVEGFFCFKLINFKIFKKTIKQIKERLNTNNKNSFYNALKFWLINIFYLLSVFVLLCAYICFYIGLFCLILGLILILIYYNF